jgi:glycosyltransferase involved in cell wall biosynthesis
VASAKDVSVVIPVYNEAAAIGPVVAGLLSQGAWREILVVDDASTDDSASAAEKAGARVIRHPYNKGNGAAVKTGIRAAQGEVVLLMDGDGQHDPLEALKLVEPIGVHDMAIGARSAQDQTATRALGNAVFNAFASWLSGRPIPDLTSGFRAARRAPLVEVLHLLPNGFSYPTTSCLAFLKAGYNVAFVKVAARPRVGVSKIRPLRDGVRFLLIILKIVTLYSPLKVFFPVAAASLLLGAAYGLWNVVQHGKIPMGSALLIQLAVVVFLFGLVSEQIAAGQDRK